MAGISFKISWTRQAVLDLEEIIDFISEDSVQGAQTLFALIKSRCESLKHHPEKARIVPELKEIGILNYRELIVGNYRVFYKVNEKTIFVFAVLDGRRDIEALLLNRLLRA